MSRQKPVQTLVPPYISKITLRFTVKCIKQFLTPCWIQTTHGGLCVCVCVCVCVLSHVHLFVTPWTVALQPLPSMKFSRKEYWSGLPLTSPGDLPDSGIEPRSPALQADSLPSEPPWNP